MSSILWYFQGKPPYLNGCHRCYGEDFLAAAKFSALQKLGIEAR